LATVTFEGASRVYPGSDVAAVDSLDLEIGDGEFLVLVGPSGCGKSTTLRMLAGLEPIDEGRVFIGECDVTFTAPKDRDIAMVFQSYALYPHMTVAENIGFHLKVKKMHKPQRATRVKEAARILDLDDLLDRKPANLSGGQRQRVAMGRAIVREPQVFLMDEPLSNLDAKLRVQTRTQIAALQRDLGVTTVYVTHDQTEAMTMGDRVAVMDRGVLQQCASPRTLFTEPVNAFVAGFIGSPAMNLLEATAGESGASFGTLTVPMTPAQRDALTSGGVTIGVRPNDFDVATSGGLDATVQFVEELGSEAFLYCVTADPDREVVARTDGLSTLRSGDRVSLVPRPDGVHLFDAVTGDRLTA
jgi:multiple sugar transport system ATP-binding protein